MNKIKEKKLNHIKSQIVEITDFVQSNFEDPSKEQFLADRNANEIKEKDTITLTKIVDFGSKISIKQNDINFIKNELNIVKLMLLNQEKVLKNILLKIE